MKRQKRRWTWKKSHLRNNTTGTRTYFRSGPPRWFVKLHHSREKMSFNTHLHKSLVRGEEVLYISSRTGRSSAKWEWW